MNEDEYPALYTYETDKRILIVNMKELLEIISRLDWDWMILPFGDALQFRSVKVEKAEYNGIEILLMKEEHCSTFSVSISLENLQNLIEKDNWRAISIAPQGGKILFYVKRLIPFDELPQKELERIFSI